MIVLSQVVDPVIALWIPEDWSLVEERFVDCVTVWVIWVSLVFLSQSGAFQYVCSPFVGVHAWHMFVLFQPLLPEAS